MSEREPAKGRDRRRFIRTDASFSILYKIKAPFEVVIEVGKNEIDSIAEDIGEGGIALISNHELPVKTQVSMTFKIFNEAAIREADSYRSFEVAGEVRYTVPWSKEGSRLGVRFMNISEPEREFIAHYVKTNSLRLDSSQP